MLVSGVLLINRLSRKQLGDRVEAKAVENEQDVERLRYIVTHMGPLAIIFPCLGMLLADGQIVH